MLRGLSDAQPIVTFGELPRLEDVQRARVALAAATACTLAAGGALAMARLPRRALFVAAPGPLTWLLVETTPSGRGFGYLGLLLGLLSLAVIAHAGARMHARRREARP